MSYATSFHIYVIRAKYLDNAFNSVAVPNKTLISRRYRHSFSEIKNLKDMYISHLSRAFLQFLTFVSTRAFHFIKYI